MQQTKTASASINIIGGLPLCCRNEDILTGLLLSVPVEHEHDFLMSVDIRGPIYDHFEISNTCLHQKSVPFVLFWYVFKLKHVKVCHFNVASEQLVSLTELWMLSPTQVTIKR